LIVVLVVNVINNLFIMTVITIVMTR